MLQQDQDQLVNADRNWTENQLRHICRSISTESVKNYQKHTVQEMYDFVSNSEVPPEEDRNEPRF